ncbi:hypothetical protein [Nocardia takedensis]|uniref:hypothetical protein n=1 Tax=Nocardia takedensis TaxID=259390 RepID=UPI0002D585E4|nr:hypothetical protein [Nocardia takedensis]
MRIIAPLSRSLTAAALVVFAPSALTTLTAPAEAAPAAETCGPYEMSGLLSGRTAVLAVQTRGDIDCDQAAAVMYRYLSDPGLARQGSAGFAFFDGWRCAAVSFGAIDDLGYSARCVHEQRGLDVRAVDAPR